MTTAKQMLEMLDKGMLTSLEEVLRAKAEEEASTQVDMLVYFADGAGEEDLFFPDSGKATGVVECCSWEHKGDGEEVFYDGYPESWACADKERGLRVCTISLTNGDLIAYRSLTHVEAIEFATNGFLNLSGGDA